MKPRNVWNSRFSSGEYEGYCFLGSDAVPSGRWLSKFHRNIFPQIRSRWKDWSIIFPEMSINIYHNARCHIPEDNLLKCHFKIKVVTESEALKIEAVGYSVTHGRLHTRITRQQTGTTLGLMSSTRILVLLSSLIAIMLYLLRKREASLNTTAATNLEWWQVIVLTRTIKNTGHIISKKHRRCIQWWDFWKEFHSSESTRLCQTLHTLRHGANTGSRWRLTLRTFN